MKIVKYESNKRSGTGILYFTIVFINLLNFIEFSVILTVFSFPGDVIEIYWNLLKFSIILIAFSFLLFAKLTSVFLPGVYHNPVSCSIC